MLEKPKQLLEMEKDFKKILKSSIDRIKYPYCSLLLNIDIIVLESDVNLIRRFVRLSMDVNLHYSKRVYPLEPHVN